MWQTLERKHRPTKGVMHTLYTHNTSIIKPILVNVTVELMKVSRSDMCRRGHLSHDCCGCGRKICGRGRQNVRVRTSLIQIVFQVR